MRTMIDFFCGGGGLGLGFKQAGWDIVQSFDFDKYAVEMYRHNVGTHVEQRDITEMMAADLQPADLWTFGFPCQDLSVAGKQAGLFEGKRSGLFFEVMRLLDESTQKPRFLLAENVSGLKPYLPVLKAEFNKRGYVMSYRSFNSKYWGVPQSRPRFFVMGVRQDIFDKSKQYFPVEDQSFVPKLSSILETNVDEKYYISDEKAHGIIEKALSIVECASTIQDVFTDRDGAAYCCDANYAKGVSANFTGTGRRVHVFEPQIDVVGRLDMRATDTIRRVYNPEGLAPTPTSCGGGHRQPKVIDSARFRVRKLTPREFARLQGFPDSYEIIVSNSQAYRIFGNAVTVNVARAIAKCMLVL